MVSGKLYILKYMVGTLIWLILKYMVGTLIWSKQF